MDYGRQDSIINPEVLVWPFHIIGLGAIGSAVAQVLAKLGVPEFHLWDDDTLEDVNRPNQLLYRRQDVGKKKVEAALEVLASYSEAQIIIHNVRFKRDLIRWLDGVIISGVDSMLSREEIWQAVKFNPQVHLYLDGRIGGEALELHTARPYMIEDVAIYEQSLFPDEEAASLPCGASSIIHPPVILAGLVANQITRWVRKESFYRTIISGLRAMSWINNDLTEQKEK